ncbi:MAG: TetR/AcrR family transcriptional regulator [Polyangiaceae bacterium]
MTYSLFIVQRPNDDVREAILRSARQRFARHGFAATTVAAVAQGAGTATGNVYRYFDDKDVLLRAAIPPSFATDLATRLAAQVRSLHGTKDPRDLPPGAEHPRLVDDLIAHGIANRHGIVFLLAKAEGTPYARVKEALVRDLVGFAIDYVHATWPGLGITPTRRTALARVYRSLLDGLADVLGNVDAADDARPLVADLGTYHRAGLGALFRSWAESARGGPDVPNDRPHAQDSVQPPARARPRRAPSPGADPRALADVPGAPPRRGRSRGRQ